MKLIQKSNFRVQGMFFQQLYWEKSKQDTLWRRRVRVPKGWIFGKVPKGEGGFRSAFFRVFLVLVVLNTIVEKHTLNPEITLLNQFHAQKALFKVPKICNINFWIENDPLPPIVTFPKVQPILVSWPVPKPIKLEFRASVELPCCVCISCLVCNFLHLLCPLCHTELRCIPLAVCFVQLLCCVCNCISGAVCFLLWAVCTP